MSNTEKYQLTPALVKMRAIAKDIIFFNPKRADLTNKQLMTAFHKIMSKHGIKEGEWSDDGGRTCNNFEWTMCLTLMVDIHNRNNEIQRVLYDTPANLLSYGKTPKTKTRKK